MRKRCGRCGNEIGYEDAITDRCKVVYFFPSFCPFCGYEFEVKVIEVKLSHEPLPEFDHFRGCPTLPEIVHQSPKRKGGPKNFRSRTEHF